MINKLVPVCLLTVVCLSCSDSNKSSESKSISKPKQALMNEVCDCGSIYMANISGGHDTRDNFEEYLACMMAAKLREDTRQAHDSISSDEAIQSAVHEQCPEVTRLIKPFIDKWADEASTTEEAETEETDADRLLNEKLAPEEDEVLKKLE